MNSTDCLHWLVWCLYEDPLRMMCTEWYFASSLDTDQRIITLTIEDQFEEKCIQAGASFTDDTKEATHLPIAGPRDEEKEIHKSVKALNETWSVEPYQECQLSNAEDQVANPRDQYKITLVWDDYFVRYVICNCCLELCSEYLGV